jgi:peptidoglycan/xylan/chitin deacetylase (PgdA/CDA1 family)
MSAITSKLWLLLLQSSLVFVMLSGPALSSCLAAKENPFYPEIGFQDKIIGAENDVALTFDDGPDGDHGMTDAVLAELKSLQVKAAFFVCGNNWVDLANNETAKKTIRRIVAEGHEIGNHTTHHRHLPALTNGQIEYELRATEDILRRPDLLGPHANLTLLRAPYGQPFEADPVNVPRVASIFSKHGIHIGWNINSYDWACETSSCVVDNVLHAIDAGQRGSVLLHSNYKVTVEALPTIVHEIRARGLKFVGVEDLLQKKYGCHSGACERSGSSKP